MSTNNEMDPGPVADSLPELTQVEEMILARSHVQMVLFRYRGHQYHYSGHCVSFMQNTVKTVTVLPNLPADLDIVLVRPPDTGQNPKYVSPRYAVTDRTNPYRYQRQFKADFRVRKRYILIWLYYLQAHHPDYRYITVSYARLESLPEDGDVSDAFPTIVDPTNHPTDPVDDAADTAAPNTDRLPPVNTQSMVLNLHVTATEADLICGELTGRNPQPYQGIPAPSIRMTPLDESSGNERIFTMAFPTLYPTGRADFNSPRLRSVSLSDYARHLLCYRDGRFGRHPRWRFLVFNMIMRRKAATVGLFYPRSGIRLGLIT